MNKMKYALECIGNRIDQIEKAVSKLNDRNTEMIQVEDGRKLGVFKSEVGP